MQIIAPCRPQALSLFKIECNPRNYIISISEIATVSLQALIALKSKKKCSKQIENEYIITLNNEN